MKKWLAVLTLSTLFVQGFGSDDINQYRRETDSIWRRGAGSEDGAFTAISLSMLGWGVGLAAGIGILASVLHQSTASSHTESTGHCCH
jgi:hypothetical protein